MGERAFFGFDHLLSRIKRPHPAAAPLPGSPAMSGFQFVPVLQSISPLVLSQVTAFAVPTERAKPKHANPATQTERWNMIVSPLFRVGSERTFRRAAEPGPCRPDWRYCVYGKYHH